MGLLEEMGAEPLIGYMRVSKADGSQANDLQRDALIAAGVDAAHLYEDRASGKREERPGLIACLKALRPDDTLIVWKLDRLGRDLRHLINTVHDLTGRGIGLKVLTGHGATIDTTTAAGKLVFGIFAALAEFERELIAERTTAGLASARARAPMRSRPCCGTMIPTISNIISSLNPRPAWRAASRTRSMSSTATRG